MAAGGDRSSPLAICRGDLHRYRGSPPKSSEAIKKERDGNVESSRITDGDGGGGRRIGLQFRRLRPNAGNAPAPTENAAPTADNAVMLTVFLKHDQSRPLSELNAQLDRQGYYKAFPPAGIEVVSWYVMMGVGQVVTLRLPASRLREVNRLLETMAPGAPIAPSSIRPMTTRRSASPRTTRRYRRALNRRDEG